MIYVGNIALYLCGGIGIALGWGGGLGGLCIGVRIGRGRSFCAGSSLLANRCRGRSRFGSVFLIVRSNLFFCWAIGLCGRIGSIGNGLLLHFGHYLLFSHIRTYSFS
jgi:hypothetical protein